MNRTAILTLLAILSLSACDSGSEPEEQFRDLDGLYVHSETFQGQPFGTNRLTLDIPSTSSGTFQLGPRSSYVATRNDVEVRSDNISGTGTYDPPSLTITFSSTGSLFDGQTFTGSTSEFSNDIRGSMSGGGSFVFSRRGD